ncbi:helix-turn-helix transcriptional regulator [Mycolicibacterium lutetiense]|uniref:DNA-binding transcriptional regulator AlpA n=1 Tax=Mycolicibacterium lutetiense TaxID=1641992 RepID=A0ABS5A1Q1_9MYCO|nr:helix-turn-helix domain-containing protein [Mycolicibacterium lutetiense]MBP2455689.1 putative DNA-binding transcriptional regulator AlpA [Mycolicibacterium lutetiense]
MDDEIIGTPAVSKMIGIPVGTLRYFRSTNQGPASFSLGRRVVYRRSEVERWIAEQEAATRRGGTSPEVA